MADRGRRGRGAAESAPRWPARSSSPRWSAPQRVDQALGLAAITGRFADDDLPAILDHLAVRAAAGEAVLADEAHSAQPGTGGWAALGAAEVTR